MERCVEEIRTWMVTDKLRLNDYKTEFLIFGTKQQLSKISRCHLTIGSATVSPANSARDLGTWMGRSLTLQDHINKACRAAYFRIYNIRHIRTFLTKETTQILVHSLVISGIDYCNSLLFGLPAVHVAKFSYSACRIQRQDLFPLPHVFIIYYTGAEIPSLAPR